MSERDPLTSAAAAMLRQTDLKPRHPDDNDRMRAIIAMENARDDGRRRRLARIVAPLVAAAGILLVLGVHALRRPRPVAPSGTRAETLAGSVRLIRDASEVQVPLGAGAAVHVGDRLVTSDGIAAITLATGTLLTADRGTDLTVVSSSATQTFFLATGAVHARVAKLLPGDRFIVATTDAEIEVRGTAFRVVRVPSDPRCASNSTTRVLVEEGIVVVRAAGMENRIGAGESWPNGCTLTPAVAPSVSALQLPSAPAAVTSATWVAPKPSALAPTSDLAEQNDLFGSAMAAKRAGNARLAVSKLERLLAKYPGAALGEQATVERFKLLALYDRPRARDAAEAYLARYPKGYARVEAKALTDKP